MNLENRYEYSFSKSSNTVLFFPRLELVVGLNFTITDMVCPAPSIKVSLPIID